MQALSVHPISVVGRVSSKRRCLAPTRWQPPIRAMRAVVQRVDSASVEVGYKFPSLLPPHSGHEWMVATLQVDGRIVSEIGPGLLVLVGLHESDTDADADYMCVDFSEFVN